MCLRAKCFLATVIMCRRTLEGLCCHFENNFQNLAAGLKKLHDDKFIDNRLFEWAEALRKNGNLAAHDPGISISWEDASDLLDFTRATLDYVFVLHERFEEFKKRRAERETAVKKKAKTKEEGL